VHKLLPHTRRRVACCDVAHGMGVGRAEDGARLVSHVPVHLLAGRVRVKEWTLGALVGAPKGGVIGSNARAGAVRRPLVVLRDTAARGAIVHQRQDEAEATPASGVDLRGGGEAERACRLLVERSGTKHGASLKDYYERERVWHGCEF